MVVEKTQASRTISNDICLSKNSNNEALRFILLGIGQQNIPQKSGYYKLSPEILHNLEGMLGSTDSQKLKILKPLSNELSNVLEILRNGEMREIELLIDLSSLDAGSALFKAFKEYPDLLSRFKGLPIRNSQKLTDCFQHLLFCLACNKNTTESMIDYVLENSGLTRYSNSNRPFNHSAGSFLVEKFPVSGIASAIPFLSGLKLMKKFDVNTSKTEEVKDVINALHEVLEQKDLWGQCSSVIFDKKHPFRDFFDTKNRAISEADFSAAWSAC